MIRLAIKHGVAATLLVAIACAVAFVSYFGAMLWAILAGAPIGGPLFLPFFMVAAFALASAAVFWLIAPPVVAAELVRRCLSLRRAWEIPLASLACAGACLLVAALVARAIGAESWLLGAGMLWAALALPLGIYWWSLQLTDGAVGAGVALVRWLGKRRATA